VGRLDAGEITQVASTALAAVAALAAWATVRQGQRVWRHSIEPHMSVQVLKSAVTHSTVMMVLNEGGGTARGVAFALVAGGKQVTDFIGDGFVAPGAKVLINTDLPEDDDAECVVMWRNADESSYALDRVGPARRLRGPTRSSRARRKVKPRSIEDVWALCYPDHPMPGLPEGGRQITIGKAS
jgi:hypothetical protein